VRAHVDIFFIFGNKAKLKFYHLIATTHYPKSAKQKPIRALFLLLSIYYSVGHQIQ